MLRHYLKFLSLCYLLMAGTHVLELVGVKGHFASEELLLQTWIVYLTLADFVAAFALWQATRTGELLFLAVTLSQLVVFLGWAPYFGSSYFLVGFHFVTLGCYLVLLTLQIRVESQQQEN